MAYGFRPVTNGSYNYQTAGFQEIPIDPDETDRISNGDMVTLTDDYGIVRSAGVPTPLIISAAEAVASTLPTNQVAGIFVGCRYTDANSTPTWAQFFPGSGSTSDAFAFVVTDPNAVFKIRSTDEWAEADLGNLVNPTNTASTAASGNSAISVTSNDQVANAALRIIGVVRDGSDITSASAECDLLVQWSSPTCLLSGYQTAVA